MKIGSAFNQIHHSFQIFWFLAVSECLRDQALGPWASKNSFQRGKTLAANLPKVPSAGQLFNLLDGLWKQTPPWIQHLLVQMLNPSIQIPIPVDSFSFSLSFFYLVFYKEKKIYNYVYKVFSLFYSFPMSLSLKRGPRLHEWFARNWARASAGPGGAAPPDDSVAEFGGSQWLFISLYSNHSFTTSRCWKENIRKYHHFIATTTNHWRTVVLPPDSLSLAAASSAEKAAIAPWAQHAEMDAEQNDWALSAWLKRTPKLRSICRFHYFWPTPKGERNSQRAKEQRTKMRGLDCFKIAPRIW